MTNSSRPWTAGSSSLWGVGWGGDGGQGERKGNADSQERNRSKEQIVRHTHTHTQDVVRLSHVSREQHVILNAVVNTSINKMHLTFIR